MDDNIVEVLQKKELIGIVVNAIRSTIEEFTNTKVQNGIPQISNCSLSSDLAILGLIRYEGKNLNFELILGFTLPLYQLLYQKMFNFEIDEVSEEGMDLAGEILNIAFGKMDPILKSHGISLRSSLPIVYFGEHAQSILSKVMARCLIIPFDANGKKFEVKIFSGHTLCENWQYTTKAS